jgi:hypothetical protein
MLVALTAVVPRVLVIITVVTAIVITLAVPLVIARSGDHASRGECKQPQENAASKNALYISHVCSSR